LSLERISEPQVNSEDNKIDKEKSIGEHAVIIIGDNEGAKEAAKSIIENDSYHSIYVNELVKTLLENEEQKPDQCTTDKIFPLKEKPECISISKLVICTSIKGEQEKKIPIWSDQGKIAVSDVLESLHVYVPLLIKQELVQSKILLLGHGVDYIKAQLSKDLKECCENVTLVQ